MADRSIVRRTQGNKINMVKEVLPDLTVIYNVVISQGMQVIDISCITEAAAGKLIDLLSDGDGYFLRLPINDGDYGEDPA